LTNISAICATVVITGLFPLTAPSAYAAEDVNEKAFKALQEENEKLRQELQRIQDLIKEGKLVDPNQVNPEESTAVSEQQETPTEDELVSEEDNSQNLAEVVVKAKPRLAATKNKPTSSSVRTGADLSKELALDLDSILQRAGNVQWNYGNPRQSSLSIRGIGKQGQTDAMDPSVGITVDGVPYPYQPLTNFDQFDVDQVEVARGPRGTEGGKNAILGEVNIRYRRPSFTPDINYALTYGSFDTFIGDAAAGGPLIDDFLAWRGAVHINKGDGEISNAPNIDKTQTWYNKDRVAGRVQLLFTPTDNFNARLSFDIQPTTRENTNGNEFFKPTPGFFANGTVNPLTTDASTRLKRRWFVEGKPEYSYEEDYLGRDHFNLNAQQPLKTASKGGLVELNWDIDGYRLTSITAVRDYSFLADNDDGTPFDINLLNGTDLPDYLQKSQELRLTSKVDDLVDYQTGIYLLEKTMTRINRGGWGDDAGAWFASNSQYNRLDADSAGRNLMKDSLSGLRRLNPQKIRNQTASFFADANWHLTDSLFLKTGLRFSYEKRKQTTERFISEQGFGQALNDVSLGGFDSDGTTGELTAAALADPNQVALANTVAQKYFKIPDYTLLTPAQQRQVADAKSIRRQQIGTLWEPEHGITFEDIQPTYIVSPSYVFNDNLTGYVSWQYGEKAGFSQTNNGIAFAVKPEKTNAFEIGLKSSLFDDTLFLNLDFYYTDIKNYQQAAQVLDEFTTNLQRETDPTAPPVYVSVTSNAKGVRALGVELDAFYRGIPFTTINFSGAFNDAIYTDFKNMAKAPELNYPGSPAFRDATGERLPGAAQFTFSISPEVRFPLALLNSSLFGEFHASFTTSYTSRYNSDITLSSYGFIPANSVTDLSIGVGSRNRLFDISFVGKNVFGNDTPYGVTWNSFQLGRPQWFGVMVSGKI
jgi:iron complex outermembrane receptor protein